MSDFNDIGISRELDLPRIEKLLKIGLFSGLIAFIGDWMLGYGTQDPNVTGFLPGFLSTFLKISDSRFVAAGILDLSALLLKHSVISESIG